MAGAFLGSVFCRPVALYAYTFLSTVPACIVHLGVTMCHSKNLKLILQNEGITANTAVEERHSTILHTVLTICTHIHFI